MAAHVKGSYPGVHYTYTEQMLVQLSLVFRMRTSQNFAFSAGYEVTLSMLRYHLWQYPNPIGRPSVRVSKPSTYIFEIKSMGQISTSLAVIWQRRPLMQSLLDFDKMHKFVTWTKMKGHFSFLCLIPLLPHTSSLQQGRPQHIRKLSCSVGYVRPYEQIERILSFQGVFEFLKLDNY